MVNKTYEGWKNYATWNCALWINNEYSLYISAVNFMRDYKGVKPYRDWVNAIGLNDKTTTDGCKWLDKSLAYSELNDMMKGLVL